MSLSSNLSGKGFCEVSVGETAGRVLTARGTEDGLVLRIDGGAVWLEILADVENFLGGRKKFFEGGEVTIEWLERLPAKEQCSELEQLLREKYGLTIASRRKKAPRPAGGQSKVKGPGGMKRGDTGVTVPLFDGEGGVVSQVTSSSATSYPSGPAYTSGREATGKDLGLSAGGQRGSVRYSESESREGRALLDEIEMLAAGRFTEGRLSEASGAEGLLNIGPEGSSGSQRRQFGQVRKVLGEDLFYEDDANAKIFCGTVRSGQRIETPFSLVVIGDVNPGADLVAGGDIVVLGSLRGTAHAAAYDDEAFDRVIIALQMQPMQLRIGSIISRGSDDVVHGAEIARIENRKIVVEAYNPRGLPARKW